MKNLSLVLLLIAATAHPALVHGDLSTIVVNLHEATPTLESVTLEIQSVDRKKSWFLELDRTPYDDGFVPRTFVAELPFSGKVKFVWWVNSYFDKSLAPRKGIVDKRTYLLKEGAWTELPNVVAESNGKLDPDFMGHTLSTYHLVGYKRSTEETMAHLFTYPDRYVARSLDEGDVVARVPARDGLSNFTPCLLSFAPGTYGMVHPDSSFSDDPEWLITDEQEFEAGFFYDAYFEDGVLLGAYPVEWVEPQDTRDE